MFASAHDLDTTPDELLAGGQGVSVGLDLEDELGRGRCEHEAPPVEIHAGIAYRACNVGDHRWLTAPFTATSNVSTAMSTM